jgi:hypothetical protein
MPNFEGKDVRNSSAWTVNTIIRRSGINSFNTGAVTPPFMPGITQSKRMKSGFSFVAFSIASAPSTASPQTANPE